MTLDFRISARSQELRSKWNTQRGNGAREVFILLAVDLVAIAFSTVIAAVFRNAVGVFDQPTSAEYLTPDGAVIVALWFAMLAASGAYRLRRTGAGTSEYVSVLNAFLFGMPGLGALVGELLRVRCGVPNAFPVKHHMYMVGEVYKRGS